MEINVIIHNMEGTTRLPAFKFLEIQLKQNF